MIQTQNFEKQPQKIREKNNTKSARLSARKSAKSDRHTLWPSYQLLSASSLLFSICRPSCLRRPPRSWPLPGGGPSSWSPLPSSGSPLLSSGSPLPSSGSPLPSSGSHLPSSGSPLPSSGSPLQSSASPLQSSASPLPSSGSPLESSGSPLPSSGSPLQSSGSPPAPAGPAPSSGHPHPPGHLASPPGVPPARRDLVLPRTGSSAAGLRGPGAVFVVFVVLLNLAFRLAAVAGCVAVLTLTME